MTCFRHGGSEPHLNQHAVDEWRCSCLRSHARYDDQGDEGTYEGRHVGFCKWTANDRGDWDTCGGLRSVASRSTLSPPRLSNTE